MAGSQFPEASWETMFAHGLVGTRYRLGTREAVELADAGRGGDVRVCVRGIHASLFVGRIKKMGYGPGRLPAGTAAALAEAGLEPRLLRVSVPAGTRLCYRACDGSLCAAAVDFEEDLGSADSPAADALSEALAARFGAKPMVAAAEKVAALLDDPVAVGDEVVDYGLGAGAGSSGRQLDDASIFRGTLREPLECAKGILFGGGDSRAAALRGCEGTDAYFAGNHLFNVLNYGGL